MTLASVAPVLGHRPPKGLSESPGAHHPSGGPRRPDRCHGAGDFSGAPCPLRPARDHHQSGGRRRQYRRRASGQVAAGRLYAAGLLDRLCRQSEPLSRPGYDPFRDFIPITELGSSPNVISSCPPGHCLPCGSRRQSQGRQEQTERHQPGTRLYAAFDGGAPAAPRRHRRGEHPYNGAGPAIQALLANTTPVGITALPPAHPHIKSGALRALAITGEKRWFDLPDVPTTEEAGYKGLVSETFQGMFAPAGTPAPIIQRVAPTRWRFWPNPRLSRSCVASDSTCAPAAQRASRSASPARCRCGATSSSSRA